MEKKKKNIIMILIIIVCLGTAGFLLTRNNQSVAPALTSSLGGNPGQVASDATPTTVDQSFLDSLRGITTLTLDDSVFKDPAFTSLVDLTTELGSDGTPGRPNPFLPVGAEVQ